MAEIKGKITDAGAILTTALVNGGTPDPITKIAFGIGNGDGRVVNIEDIQENLINEKYRIDVDDKQIDPEDPKNLIVTTVIDETDNFDPATYNEMQLITASGIVFAVSNDVFIFSSAQQNSQQQTTVQFVIVTENGEELQVLIDPNVSLISESQAQAIAIQNLEELKNESDPFDGKYELEGAGTVSIDLYLSNVDSNIAGYKQISLTPLVNPVEEVKLVELDQNQTITTIEQFATQPFTNDINIASSRLNIDLDVLSTDDNTSIRATFGRIDDLGNETNVNSTQLVLIDNNEDIRTVFALNRLLPVDIEIAAGDRFFLRVEAIRDSGSSQDLTLYYNNENTQAAINASKLSQDLQLATTDIPIDDGGTCFVGRINNVGKTAGTKKLPIEDDSDPLNPVPIEDNQSLSISMTSDSVGKSVTIDGNIVESTQQQIEYINASGNITQAPTLDITGLIGEFLFSYDKANNKWHTDIDLRPPAELLPTDSNNGVVVRKNGATVLLGVTAAMAGMVLGINGSGELEFNSSQAFEDLNSKGEELFCRFSGAGGFVDKKTGTYLGDRFAINTYAWGSLTGSKANNEVYRGETQTSNAGLVSVHNPATGSKIYSSSSNERNFQAYSPDTNSVFASSIYNDGLRKYNTRSSLLRSANRGDSLFGSLLDPSDNGNFWIRIKGNRGTYYKYNSNLSQVTSKSNVGSILANTNNGEANNLQGEKFGYGDTSLNTIKTELWSNGTLLNNVSFSVSFGENRDDFNIFH